MNLRRRKPTLVGDGAAHVPAGAVERVERLEALRYSLATALAKTPEGVTFTVVGDDYLPMKDVKRQLVDVEILLQTARYQASGPAQAG